MMDKAYDWAWVDLIYNIRHGFSSDVINEFEKENKRKWKNG
jgi:hypothetical protein